MIRPHFSAFLNNERIDTLYKSAPLHDIGKIAVPDRILLKPANLLQMNLTKSNCIPMSVAK